MQQYAPEYTSLLHRIDGISWNHGGYMFLWTVQNRNCPGFIAVTMMGYLHIVQEGGVLNIILKRCDLSL